MRLDSLGLFWEDRPVEKVLKAPKPKRQPPERTWERDDYLPNLHEAMHFAPNLMTDDELFEAMLNKHELIYDVECYPNYFLVCFESTKSGLCAEFYMYPGLLLQREKLRWVMENFLTTGFNSNDYDNTMVTFALAGHDNSQLKEISDLIIGSKNVPGIPGRDLLKQRKIKRPKWDHIDLIEVAPLRASLKAYASRIHTKRMQDLPFNPFVHLSPYQMAIVRWYCFNDLAHTGLLRKKLAEQIDLRINMSERYNTDLRSKSDAQIAEAVIGDAMATVNGARPQRPSIAPGTSYRYRQPHFIRYQTHLMQWVMNVVNNANFVVSEFGNITMPPELSNLKIQIGKATYKMGIGGLHSTESCASHVACDKYKIVDRDVTSYYPMIILNERLYPQHLGVNFLTVYRQIVEDRIAAKRRKDNITSDTLKIVINGSFGKLGSMYSILYAPDLLIQVTITGQLSLLMLIETLELNGFEVLSANTDGIVIKVERAREADYLAIVKWWESVTNFETEEVEYKALYRRDVNNYIAVKLDNSTKTKGAYGEPELKKNPAAYVSVLAAIATMTTGQSIEQYIRDCKDLTLFVCARAVKGGAVKDGEYLGKTVRWYYATGVEGEIIYALTGNKVSRTDGAKPLMVLPEQFPDDVDYDWYIREAENILKDVNYC